MSDASLLTDRAQLEELFAELAGELESLGTTADVVMVGGSWMLWHELRPSTRDVDSAKKFEVDLRDVIKRIASRHDLREGWLNDHAAPFWPATAIYADCATVFETPALTVRAPRPEVVFVMKLYRADPQDREDLVALWPLCAFASLDAAAAAYAAAYPHAPEDEFMSDYIAHIARDAEE